MSEPNKTEQEFERAMHALVMENPATALSLCTGGMVGLIVYFAEENGHDPDREIKIDGGENRDITIHAKKKGGELADTPESHSERHPVPDGYCLVSRDLIDAFPELSVSNYDHDQVCDLNAWGVELVLSVQEKGAGSVTAGWRFERLNKNAITIIDADGARTTVFGSSTVGHHERTLYALAAALLAQEGGDKCAPRIC